MKKILFVVALSTLLVTACNKSKAPASTPSPTKDGPVVETWDHNLTGEAAETQYLQDIDAFTKADHIKITVTNLNDENYLSYEYIDGTSAYITSHGKYEEGQLWDDQDWVWVEDGKYCYAYESLTDGEVAYRGYTFDDEFYYRTSYRNYADEATDLYFEEALSVTYSNKGTQTTDKGVTTSEGEINLFLDFGEEQGTTAVKVTTKDGVVVSYDIVTVFFWDEEDTQTYSYHYEVEYNVDFTFEKPTIDDSWELIED